MKNLAKIEKIIRKNRHLLDTQYKVKKIGIFGSYITGSQTQKSDVDILVDFSETPDFIEFLKLEEFLRSLLGIKVDLATPKSLKSLIKAKILKNTIYI